MAINQLTAPQEEQAFGFAVEVKGEQFDTRKGVIESVYHAMVAQNPNDFNPDTPIRHIHLAGSFFPRTWITGDSATPHRAPVGHVDVKEDGSKHSEIYGLSRHTDHTGRAISFRPGIPLTRAG